MHVDAEERQHWRHATGLPVRSTDRYNYESTPFVRCNGFSRPHLSTLVSPAQHSCQECHALPSTYPAPHKLMPNFCSTRTSTMQHCAEHLHGSRNTHAACNPVAIQAPASVAHLHSAYAPQHSGSFTGQTGCKRYAACRPAAVLQNRKTANIA